jgi:HK97 gp10 family phage protein
MANKVKLQSNFLAARSAGRSAISELIEQGTEAIQETAQQRLEKAAGRRGYDLSADDITKEVSGMDGRIEYEPWYGRYFEFGTVTIQAMPFMRPGHRAGRKVVKNAEPVFEKWFRKKARLR